MQIAETHKPRPYHIPRFIAVETEKNAQDAPGTKKAVMIWDTQTQEIVGNNVYDIGTAPAVGSNSRFGRSRRSMSGRACNRSAAPIYPRTSPPALLFLFFFLFIFIPTSLLSFHHLSSGIRTEIAGDEDEEKKKRKSFAATRFSR